MVYIHTCTYIHIDTQKILLKHLIVNFIDVAIMCPCMFIWTVITMGIVLDLLINNSYTLSSDELAYCFYVVLSCDQWSLFGFIIVCRHIYYTWMLIGIFVRLNMLFEFPFHFLSLMCVNRLEVVDWCSLILFGCLFIQNSILYSKVTVLVTAHCNSYKIFVWWSICFKCLRIWILFRLPT